MYRLKHTVMSLITLNIARFSRDIAMILAMTAHIEDNTAKKMIIKSCFDMLDAIAYAWFIDNSEKAEENFRAIFESMDFDTQKAFVKKSSYGEHVVMHNLFPEYDYEG